jgi:hypothetical protein
MEKQNNQIAQKKQKRSCILMNLEAGNAKEWQQFFIILQW